MTTALIVIDMQADYIGVSCEKSFYSPALVDRVNARIAAASARGELVIYVKNAGRRKGERYVSPYAEGLTVVPGPVIEKERSSIFCSPALPEALAEVTDIEVVGIDGCCCVAASALDAAARGFAVSYPLKYIGIKSATRFEGTRRKLEKAGVRIDE